MPEKFSRKLVAVYVIFALLTVTFPIAISTWTYFRNLDIFYSIVCLFAWNARFINYSRLCLNICVYGLTAISFRVSFIMLTFPLCYRSQVLKTLLRQPPSLECRGLLIEETALEVKAKPFLSYFKTIGQLAIGFVCFAMISGYVIIIVEECFLPFFVAVVALLTFLTFGWIFHVQLNVLAGYPDNIRRTWRPAPMEVMERIETSV